MWYVYILRSKKNETIYIGSTDDLKNRVRDHNEGLSIATKAKRPWMLTAYVVVRKKWQAKKLEKYFKKGSGNTILKRRILFQ